MKRYIKANDAGLYRQLGITDDEFRRIESWCDSYDPDSDIAFEFNGSSITNPFLDPTGRFELSLADAVKTYGLDNVKQFCKDALTRMGEYVIWLGGARGDWSNTEDAELEILSSTKGFDDTHIKSSNFNDLVDYLSTHQLTQVRYISDDYSYTDVAAIFAYNPDIADYDAVAYQTFDGEVISDI